MEAREDKSKGNREAWQIHTRAQKQTCDYHILFLSSRKPEPKTMRDTTNIHAQIVYIMGREEKACTHIADTKPTEEVGQKDA